VHALCDGRTLDGHTRESFVTPAGQCPLLMRRLSPHILRRGNSRSHLREKYRPGRNPPPGLRPCRFGNH